MSLKDIKIATKLYMLIICSFLTLLLISSVLLSEYRHSMFEDRKEKIRNLAETAYSLVEEAVAEHEHGLITLEQAQEKAKNLVKGLNYDSNNYFWINDHHPKMIMHPIKPQLDNTDISHIKDPNGKALFVEMANIVKKEGDGYVSYVWDKPGSTKPASKISYVKAVPEWEWMIGTGIYVDDVEKAFIQHLGFIGTIIVIGILLVGILGWVVIKNLSTPINKIVNCLKDLTDDKVITEVTEPRKDEMGIISDALMGLNIKLQEARDISAREKENKKQAELERQQMMLKLADDFDEQIGSFIASLASASTELQSSAEGMKDISDKTSQSSDAVVSSSSEASANVNTVASAMEEMSASISEIVTQITSAKTQSNDTAHSAENANTTVSNLNELVKNIGEVVFAIQDIAEQTNLLALNATIEAARAGEAGKGFAVVAEEVKKLASETGQKTEEINGRITEIQEATVESVNAMERIIRNIGDIDTSVTGISAAAEEQNVTTNEIVRSVAEASNGVQQVSQIILDVQKGAGETRSSADSVLDASKEVAQLSENLRSSVENFLSTVRDSAYSDEHASSKNDENHAQNQEIAA